MPPKGWKKDTIVEKPVIASKITVEIAKPIIKQEDELGEESKPKKDIEYAKIIIVWKDNRGKERNTQYDVSQMTIQENISEIFEGMKKKAHRNINIDATIQEKM